MLDPRRKVVGERLRAQALALGGELIATVVVELGARRVESQVDIAARLVARLLDRLQNGFERSFVGRQIGREAALITHRGAHALGAQHRFQSVEYFDAVAQRFTKARGAHRQDHELLHVHVVVSMHAAVNNIHHRHRQRELACLSVVAGNVSVERQIHVLSGGFRHGERHRQDGIGTQAGLVAGAIEFDHGAVDARLVSGVAADERIAQLAVYLGHGLRHALATIALGVVVAQLDRFSGAGRGARGRGRLAAGARV